MGRWGGPADSGFTRQVERLRKLAGELQAQDPEGAAACLFAASVLSNLPQSAGVPVPTADPVSELLPPGGRFE